MNILSYEKLNRQQEVSESDPFTEERYRQIYSFFSSTPSTVLDIGCNTGRGGQILKQLKPNLKITGLDCVKERLELLLQQVYEQHICSLSTNIVCEDHSFDVVVSGEFIEHLYPIDVDKKLNEIFRVLKVGGRL